MGKSTHPVTRVQTGTHPETRVIDPGRSGQTGSVKPAQQPVGAPQKQPHSVDYAQRIPLSDSAKGGGKDVPMPDGNASSLQQPSDVKVETKE